MFSSIAVFLLLMEKVHKNQEPWKKSIEDNARRTNEDVKNLIEL